MVSILTGQGKLKQIVDTVESWLLDRHPFATSYEGMPVGMPSPKIMAEWRDIHRGRCPLLDDQKKCMIHDVRPLVCRSFGVTRDAVEHCPRPLGIGESNTCHAHITGEGIRSLVHEFRDTCKEHNPTWIVSGNVPVMLYRAAREDKFRLMVHDNKIASAKIIGVDFETSVMWQPQVNALNQGVSPDLVAAMA